MAAQLKRTSSIGIMTIETTTDLTKWLEDNHFFEDGHILKIENNPLKIVVGYNITGSYEAHSERRIQTFTLEPDKIKEWTLPENAGFIPSDDIYIEGIAPIDVLPNIGLEFSTPLTFRLVAGSIRITHNEIITTTFKPWVSESEIFVESSITVIPRPQYWVDKLKERGHVVVLRYFGSEEKMPDKLPYPDYSGYYIQTRNRLDKTNKGIFIEHLTKKEKSISLHFQNSDKEFKSIWNDLTLILSEMPDATIRSGNCKFSGREWREHLIKSREVL